MKGKTIFGIIAASVSLLITAIMVILMMSCDDYIDAE